MIETKGITSAYDVSVKLDNLSLEPVSENDPNTAGKASSSELSPYAFLGSDGKPEVVKDS
jgi:hypothetical protein